MSRKPLIIAEKPSAARAIADALGGFSAREGYWESAEYCLTWAIGHLVELRAPEEYDPKWKRWALDTLPIMPDAFGLKVVTKTRSQFQVIARLGKQAAGLINGCDAGREGELIFRYIYEAAGLSAPVRRLWVSSLTREAIRKAFAELKPAIAYERLYQSARCRAEGDWLVGMNATRAFTVKWGELLSVGRVQTPTLALLVNREREIEEFVPEEYWEVEGEFAADGARTYSGKWFGPEGDRLKSKAAAEAIVARVKGRPGQIESASEKPVSERPPQLYDLTTLQREANKRFGLTAAATLKAAQSLYEAKLITYPRTDSRHLAKDLLRTLPGIVRGLAGQPSYGPLAQGADLGLVHPGNRRVVDDTKVTDHHAIIPTAEAPRGLEGVEGKVYDLIARRFLAQFYPEARFQESEVITAVGELPDRFRSRGRQLLAAGWQVVEPPPQQRAAKGEEPEQRALPRLQQGERVALQKVAALRKETQPPKRYTEATLLGAMESAGKALDAEELKEAMKGRGLGTPATRAAIIERLKKVGYIGLEKKSLSPTPKGRQLVERAEAIGAQVLLSAELTGEWEKRIADIQAGDYEAGRFMQEVRSLAASVVGLVQESPGAPARGRRGAASAGDEPAEVAGSCPLCRADVLRKGRDWQCSGEGCPTRIPTWLCGLMIDRTLAETLLVKGRTAVLTGFKSLRTGKAFRASLALKAGKVAFEFPPDKPGRSGSSRARSTRRSQGERTTAAQTGSRKAGAGAAGGARAKGTQLGGTRVGRGVSRQSKPTGAGPLSD